MYIKIYIKSSYIVTSEWQIGTNASPADDDYNFVFKFNISIFSVELYTKNEIQPLKSEPCIRQVGCMYWPTEPQMDEGLSPEFQRYLNRIHIFFRCLLIFKEMDVMRIKFLRTYRYSIPVCRGKYFNAVLLISYDKCTSMGIS